MLESLCEFLKNEKYAFQSWHEKLVNKDTLAGDSFQCYNITFLHGLWLFGAILSPMKQKQNSPLAHRDSGNIAAQIWFS